MHIPTVIQTARLQLRPWRKQDREPFAQMLADHEYNRFMPGPYAQHEADARFDAIQRNADANGIGPLVVELPEKEPFIGYAGLSVPAIELPFSPCIEIGWHFSPRYWGKGYATEAAQALIQYGFTRLEIEEFVSFTALDNLASQRVMQKIGMTRDVNGDFEHPSLDADDPLRHHVLYRITNRPTST